MPSRRVSPPLTIPATRALAGAAGISRKQLRHPGMVRLSRDTYLPASLAGEVRSRVAAVLLTAPDTAVVSHLTAAALWGLAVPLQVDDARVHLTVTTGSAVRGRADRCIHRSPLFPGDVIREREFRLTTPERTWRDLAAVLEPPALLAVTDQLLALRCGRGRLEAQLSRRPTGRGSARARAVLPIADARSESPMESVLRWLVHAAGLPAPVLQFVVRDAAGDFVGRADLAWPERMVLVEFDGDLHRQRATFVHDLRRQNKLIAGGWTVLRFTSADVVGRPEKTVAAIRQALRR